MKKYQKRIIPRSKQRQYKREIRCLISKIIELSQYYGKSTFNTLKLKKKLSTCNNSEELHDIYLDLFVQYQQLSQ